MISAREGTLIYIRLSKNENLNDLQNLLENYGVTSGVLWGFGNLNCVETNEAIVEVKGSTMYGTISELKGRTLLELFVQSDKTTGKIKNFVAEEFTLIVRWFDEIRLLSRLNEKGKPEISVSEK